MPVPQKMNFIVERASCPFLKILKHMNYDEHFITNNFQFPI